MESNEIKNATRCIEPASVAQRVEREELINYLPHKGKMFLLSRVTSHDVDKHTITSEYDITPNCIFFEKYLNGVPSWVGFEFLAQGISALTGITNKIKGLLPYPGMILSVVDYKASVQSFENGTTVEMKIAEDFRDSSTRTYCYQCSLFEHIGDALPAITAKITVMEVEDINAMFNK